MTYMIESPDQYLPITNTCPSPSRTSPSGLPKALDGGMKLLIQTGSPDGEYLIVVSTPPLLPVMKMFPSESTARLEPRLIEAYAPSIRRTHSVSPVRAYLMVMRSDTLVPATIALPLRSTTISAPIKLPRGSWYVRFHRATPS